MKVYVVLEEYIDDDAVWDERFSLEYIGVYSTKEKALEAFRQKDIDDYNDERGFFTGLRPDPYYKAGKYARMYEVELDGKIKDNPNEVEE